EGLVAVIMGVMAGSLSLMAFGIDSFIEVISGSVLLWRMAADADKRGRESRERLALRLVGFCFIALDLYVAVDAILGLLRQEAPSRSIPGIVLAVVSLIVMPVLARAKRKVGVKLGSAAMLADSAQTQFCVYLSAIMLAGLILNATFGLWWADSAAALIMVPLIAKEGIEGLRGKHC
ncbi:MAG TPA: cation transporter, partial [Terriglobia bacterium]|nr:cation transporter [Terriglobia bacterium]